MSIFRPFLLILASLVLLTPCALSAQEETFQVDIRVYGLRPGDYENVWLRDYRETQKIQFKSKSRSETYRATLLRSDPVLRFVRRGQTDEGTQSSLMAQTTVPGQVRELLVIFTKDTSEDASPAYIATAIDDSMETFGLGSLRVLNMTGADIFGTFNDTRFILKNGESSLAGRTDADSSTEIAIAAEGSTRVHLLYRNNLRLAPESRGVLILRPPARSGSLRIGGHLITETIQDE